MSATTARPRRGAMRPDALVSPVQVGMSLRMRSDHPREFAVMEPARHLVTFSERIG